MRGLWRWPHHPNPRGRRSRVPGSLTTEERFWQKVERTDTCWIWTACRVGVGHYGLFWGGSEVGKIYAHRYAYQQFVGPIPEGFVVDHLCRVRWCVNPDHLEPVTPQENLRRMGELAKAKTHCKRGHLFSADNIKSRAGGRWRACRECDRIYKRAWRRARREIK